MENRYRIEPVKKPKDREEWDKGFLSLRRASEIFVSKGAFLSVCLFFSTYHSLPFKIFTFWSCCEKCGNQFPDQRSNTCPLHWLCGLNTGLEVPLPVPSVFHRWLPSYWRNVLGKRLWGKGKMNSQTLMAGFGLPPGMGWGL